MIGAALVALAVLVAADSASACSCAPQAPAESLREADAAVVARLVAVFPHGPSQALYRYEVRRVYKGREKLEAGRMLDVHSSRRSAACALPRRIGRTYGLFLLSRHNRWFGSICRVVSPKRMRRVAQSQPTDSARAPVQPVLCG
jgi:hypothetical protein